jgi:hypothetical protein
MMGTSGEIAETLHAGLGRHACQRSPHPVLYPAAGNRDFSDALIATETRIFFPRLKFLGNDCASFVPTDQTDKIRDSPRTAHSRVAHRDDFVVDEWATTWRVWSIKLQWMLYDCTDSRLFDFRLSSG